MQIDITSFLGNQSKTVLVLCGLLALVLLGLGDYLATAKLLEFSVFFALPVSFCAWFLSRRTGIVASVISAAIVMGIDLSSPVHEINGTVAYWNALIWLGFFFLVTLVIAELKVLHVRERELSRVDSLTRVPSRLAFYEFATAEISRARRFRLATTLAYVDLDGFKGINDRMGHATGDKVLIAVARSMQRSIRDTDLVARMGGDEFALILPNTGKDAACKVLEKLMNNVSRSMRHSHWPITFSVGAVTFLKPPESLDQMIQQADAVMYSVKQSGKDRLRQEDIAA
jgi:diguanylate cyclase (GGDEF)-like protein